MTISLAQLKKSTLYSEALGIDLSKNTDPEKLLPSTLIRLLPVLVC
jgi:hypothetical protein